MMPAKAVHPARYRANQFFAALRAGLPRWAGGVRDGLTPDDAAWVASILTTPAQQQLFTRMPPNDRRHALAVARALQQAGYTDPALLQAALLHDVGKSLGQPIFHRVLIVLLKAFWPSVLNRLAQDTTQWLALEEISRWRRPFVIHAHHPAIGAGWAKNAGCEAGAVHLIAAHEKTTGADERLAALQRADNVN